MKFRRFLIPVVAAVLVAVVAVTSIVPAYAAGAAVGSAIEDVLWNLIKKCLTPDGGSSEFSGEQQLAYLNSVWIRSCDNLKEVDYDVLSYVYAQLLMEGVPCEIRISRGSDQGYYIRGTGDMAYDNGRCVFPIKDRYFSDTRGNIFYARLPDNGKSPGSTTVPSTTAPSVSKDEGTDHDSTYVSDPSTPSDSTTELSALNRLVKAVYTQIKSIHGIWRVNINMYNIQIKLRRLMWDTIDGINNVTDGIYEQVDLLTGYLPRLDDIYNRLFNIQSASWASVDVENRIYSGVTGIGSRLDTLVTNSAGIGSRLDSIINNGAVQVNTSPIEARLDKLISMYRKVNSVVLDTASISSGSVSSGSIRSAVGGELEDAVFWGMSGYNSANSFAYADPLTYVLNDVEHPVIDRPLRGIQLGTSIPDSLNSSDSVLMAGVWKLANGQYEISDTYNAATGEYVQRLYTQSYNGTENWNMAVKSDGMNLFYLSDYAFEYLEANRYSMSGWSQFKYRPYAYAFNADKNAAAAYKNTYTIWGRNIRFVVDAAEYPDVATWKTRLSNMAAAGTPLEIWWVPSVSGKTYSDGPIVETLDRITVAIPEGNSSIFGNRVRITGKYETYDSYTQTADIIAAINNIQAGVTPDLEPIVSRLDTLINQSSDTVVNVVTNNTYITNVYQLDDENDVADRSKEGIEKIGGVFKWLWKHAFKDAFDAADILKLDGLL